MTNCPLCGCGLEFRMIMRYQPNKPVPDAEAAEVSVCRSCGFHAYSQVDVVDAPDSIRITPDKSTTYIEFSGGERRVLAIQKDEFVDDRPNGFNLPVPHSWLETEGDEQEKD